MSFLKIILYIAIILGMIFIAQFLNVKYDIPSPMDSGLSVFKACVHEKLPDDLQKDKTVQFCSCVRKNNINNSKDSKKLAYEKCLEKYRVD